jgi:glycosyltransferase involved in cell wall biosynthesis
MKIAIINISDRVGGAALAAWRTGETISSMGHEVIYIVRNASVSRSNIIPTRKSSFQNTVEQYFNAGMSLLGIQYLWLPFSPGNIRKSINKFQPDVIWVNNTLGGYFQTNELNWLSTKAPVVWTLHDMWAFTASGAHTMGKEDWKNMKACAGEKKIYPTIGLPTGNWLIRIKQKIYQKAKPIFVTPSRWLFKLAQSSPLLANQQLLYLTHGLDLSVFSPGDTTTARKSFGIPEGVPVIVFLAQKLNGNFFKGGQDLKDILDELNSKATSPIHVLLLGEDTPEYMKDYKQLVIHSAGYVKDELKLVAAYRSADLLLYPTRADNMPLVLMEACACGTPIVTFDVGGCSEIAIDGKNGYVLKPGENTLAAEKVLALLTDSSLRLNMAKQSRLLAEEKYNLNTQATQYLNVFQENIDAWKRKKKH